MLDSIKHSIKKSLIVDIKDLQLGQEQIQLDLLFDDKGDLSSNICMQLSKQLQLPPKKISEIIIKNFDNPFIESLELAGPGFINLFLNEEGLQKILLFTNELEPKIKPLNIEFVSANPTGPLHLAHGRGAVVGDVLSNLYEFHGYEVNREYYVNNTGNQIHEFLSSILFSISKKNNLNLNFKQFYKGDYINEIADICHKKFNEQINNNLSSEIQQKIVNFAVNSLLEKSLEVLSKCNITFDTISYETDILNKGIFPKALSKLKEQNLIYTGKLQNPKDYDQTKKDNDILIFKSTNFGDDEDRALTKNDGNPTYFANDIAYHLDKINRGFSKLINIWGADHLGYLVRLKSAINSINQNIDFNVVFCQIVNIKRNNQIQKLSKREGNIYELIDLINEIGVDNFRFFMCYRKNDTHMDLDIDLIKKENKENPIYYIQYASARCNSILKRKPKIINKKFIMNPDLKILYKKIYQWNNVLNHAFQKNEVHLISHYLESLSSTFHSYWSAAKTNKDLRFLDSENNLSIQMEILLNRFKITLNQGLGILGIDPKSEM